MSPRTLGAVTPSEETRALLGDRSFRRLYGGRLVGRVGDKIGLLAALWLVYELTGSTAYTGLAGFLARAPTVLSALLGPLVDRSRLDRLLAGAEALQAVVALAVPVAAWLGHLSVGVVLASLAGLAFLRRVSAPAEQAILPRVVDERLLPRANSLDSATLTALGAVAEGVGGALIALVGAVALYVANAATFVVSAALFAAIALPTESEQNPEESADSGTNSAVAGDGGQEALEEDRPTGRIDAFRDALGTYRRDLRAGLDLIAGSAARHMVAAAALAGLFGGMATAVLPAFATGLGGPDAYGLLVGAATAGTFVGSVLAVRVEDVGLGRLTVAGFALAAAARVAAAFAGARVPTVALFALAAVPVGAYNVLASATLQTAVPDGMLARASSTTSTLKGLVGPFGLLVGGALGERLAVPVVVALSGVGYLAVAVYWALVPTLRGFPAATAVEPGRFGRA